jgi:hypothetical protein
MGSGQSLRERGDAGVPAEWDEGWYRSVFIPRLAEISLKEIMEVAGCSKAYASDLWRGKYMAHVATWTRFTELVQVAGPVGIAHY